MRKIFLLLALSSLTALHVAPALAHGDEPHPKCKKGYVVNDQHKCVKKD